MSMISELGQEAGFHELSPRERLAALFDGGTFTELLDPFERIDSPWLLRQGLVPQSDDGVVIVQGAIDGQAVVGIAIEGSFEGGSIGEVGGAKIATALTLAAESCLAGTPVAALLLLETGGVRLQEATLGLAAIADIQSAIIALREQAPVIAVIAGPVGCFGGMSLAAELCTYIIGTPHGRLGMNGPEVIEQEAGTEEIDAGDRGLEPASLWGHAAAMHGPRCEDAAIVLRGRPFEPGHLGPAPVHREPRPI
jgi:malonate decarboxylase beta subunit